MDRALEEEARKARSVCRDDRVVAADVEKTLVLAGKARVREILSRCRASNREARFGPVLLAQRVVRDKNFGA